MNTVSTSAPADNTPATLIGEIVLNAKDVVRVELGSYNGREVVSLRKWYKEGDKVLPSPKGLTIAAAHLPRLAELVVAAVERARGPR